MLELPSSVIYFGEGFLPLIKVVRCGIDQIDHQLPSHSRGVIIRRQSGLTSDFVVRSRALTNRLDRE